MADVGATAGTFRSMLLSTFFRSAAPPAQLFVTVTLAVPIAGIPADSLLEPADENYARQPYPLLPTHWDITDQGETSQTQPVLFVPPTVDWGLLVGWALTDLPVSGLVLAGGEIQPSQYIAAGDDPVAIGEYSIQIALV